MTSQSTIRIGIAGAGIMGHGMGVCLLRAGFPVTVVAHRNRTPINDLINKGALESATITELVDEVDVILLCLPDSTVVESVIDQIIDQLRPGQMLIDTGTSQPNSTRGIARRLAQKDIAFVEAPVTGGKSQAVEGELGALVGCEEAHFERASVVLKSFCRTVIRFGMPGAGGTAKLINNYMVMGITALVVDVFERADVAEVDWQQLFDVVVCGSGDSGVLHRFFPEAAQGDFTGYAFALKSALKDLGYFHAEMEQQGGASELAGAVKAVFQRAVDAGYGERMMSELLSPELRSQVSPNLLSNDR